MWIKRDFTLSHCHPNIRTIAKPQYVLSGKWWVFTDSLARKKIPKRGRGYPTIELAWKPQMFLSKCRILGISNETVGLEGIESLFFVPPKTFSQNKTAVLTHLVRYKTFSRDKINILFWLS